MARKCTCSTLRLLCDHLLFQFRFVGRFLPRVARVGDEAKKFLNIYAKNLPDDIDDVKLTKMFDKFGEILSCVVSEVFFVFST
jgi:hypothetical protein